MVDWQSIKSPKHKGTGVYTASWTAPLKAGVHSAQHWYYMGEKVRLSRNLTSSWSSCAHGGSSALRRVT
jgi:hypothetical protein